TAQPSQIDFNVSKYYYGLLNPVGEFPLLFKWGFISINYRINKKPEMSAIFVQTQAALKARPIAACLSSSKEALSPCLSLLKNPISGSRGFTSKNNAFLGGQFHSRHFLWYNSRRSRRKQRGLAVSPSCVLPLTEENVEKILDEVRPSLMADGGNVALHEIDGLVVVLKLQGACGSCPSSTMTLKMGIETRLRDKIPEILEVEQIMDTETGLELNEENVEKCCRFLMRLDRTW
ncbi:NFU domain protein 3 isoform 4, partial [Theobroma cacao]